MPKKAESCSVILEKKSVAGKVLRHIAEHQGLTNGAMMAADFRMKYETVKKVVARLEAAGCVERSWDGDGLQLTNEAEKDRQNNAYFRKSFPNLKGRR